MSKKLIKKLHTKEEVQGQWVDKEAVLDAANIHPFSTDLNLKELEVEKGWSFRVSNEGANQALIVDGNLAVGGGIVGLDNKPIFISGDPGRIPTIRKVSVKYGISFVREQKPTAWLDEVPKDAGPGNYIWVQNTIEYSDSEPHISESLVGVFDSTVSSVYSYYLLSNNSTDRPRVDDPSWVRTPKIASEENIYLWGYNEIKYSDNSKESIKTIPYIISVFGKKGKEGTILYSWVKYADDLIGTNLSDSSKGKKFVGYSFNNPSYVKSDDYTDYEWFVSSNYYEEEVKDLSYSNGLNLIKNSVMFNEQYFWRSYEVNEEGVRVFPNLGGVVGATDSWTLLQTSKNALTTHLGDGVDEQVVQLLAGHKYSLSFKSYKQSASGEIEVYLKFGEEVEYSFVHQEVGERTVSYNLEPRENTEIVVGVRMAGLNKEFPSYVADLMLTKGNIYEWSPAIGESYSTRVLVDSTGIRVRSNDGFSYTSMTPYEFAHYYDGDKVFEMDRVLARFQDVMVEGGTLELKGALKFVNDKDNDRLVLVNLRGLLNGE